MLSQISTTKCSQLESVPLSLFRGSRRERSDEGQRRDTGAHGSDAGAVEQRPEEDRKNATTAEYNSNGTGSKRRHSMGKGRGRQFDIHIYLR